MNIIKNKQRNRMSSVTLNSILCKEICSGKAANAVTTTSFQSPHLIKWVQWKKNKKISGVFLKLNSQQLLGLVKQITYLVDYLSTNIDFANGEYTGPLGARRYQE